MADTTVATTGTPIPPRLVWGTYRASPSKWHVPAGAVQLPGSAPAVGPGPGGVVSPMVALADGTGWEARLSLPAKLAPVTLALAFEEVGMGATAAATATTTTRPLAIPVGMGPGDPTRLGATVAAVPAGSKPGALSVSFAVQSRGAAAVSLVLARGAPSADASADGRSPSAPASAASCLEIALSRDVQSTGDIWHAQIDGLTDLATLTWAWRADGGLGGDVRGAAFAPGQVMLDPYAPAAAWLALPEGVNVAFGGLAGGGGALANPPAIVGCLAALVDGGGGAGAAPPPPRPNLAAEGCIVLEVNPMADADPAASLAALTGRVGALASSGVTALLVAGPVVAAAPGPAPGNPRAPISLFAPDPALAPAGAAGFGLGAGQAIKALIAAAHGSGLEVWVQTEACFTAEAAGAPGVEAAPPTALPRALSLRGLDAVAYYRPGGRVLNVGSPAVRALVLAAARHWAGSLCVDGLVWAHAESLAQDRDGTILDGPPLPDALAADPALRGRVKLIASATDPALLPRQGGRGFPHFGVWMEKDWGLACLLRRLLGAGAPGQASTLAGKVLGNPILAGAAWGELPDCLAAPRRAAFLLNAVVPPDTAAVGGGVRAAAEVAIAAGPPLDPAAAAAQATTLAKTLLVAACLLPGAPLLPVDALGEATGGPRFLASLLALRAGAAGAALAPTPADLADVSAAEAAAAAPAAPGSGPPPPSAWRALAWHGAHAAAEPDWDEGRAAAGEWGAGVIAWTATVGQEVGGPAGGLPAKTTAAAVYVALNPHAGPVPLVLPPPPAGRAWRRAVDTSLAGPTDAPKAGDRLTLGTPDYDLGPRAALVLIAEKA